MNISSVAVRTWNSQLLPELERFFLTLAASKEQLLNSFECQDNGMKQYARNHGIVVWVVSEILPSGFFSSGGLGCIYIYTYLYRVSAS